MKIYIMTDLEGPSGVNGRSDGTGNDIINEDIARDCLLTEVNACVEGLKQGGADEIVVWDGHGGSCSIDIRKLHPAASLGNIGCEFEPVTFLDDTYDAAIQIGAHSMQGTRGALSHSFNSHAIQSMQLNGELIGEIGMQTMQAAYFRVPMILVSGDQLACQEAREIAPKVTTVCTKRSLARYTVINRSQEAVCAEFREKSRLALEQLKEYPVNPLPSEFILRVLYFSSNKIDRFRKMGLDCPDDHTVVFKSNDFIDILAQFLGWAPGVHNRIFQIHPSSK